MYVVNPNGGLAKGHRLSLRAWQRTSQSQVLPVRYLGFHPVN